MIPLPAGLRLALDPRARRGGHGALLGGSPRRVVRLSDAGERALAALERGAATGEGARSLGRRLVDAGLAHPRPEPRRAGTEVTVVVPARDRPEHLERCLAALGHAAKVVVVDDGSRDPDTLRALASSHGARLIRRGIPGGPGAARNAALSALDTELVAFVDSDCVPMPGWLDALVGHFDDPLVAAVAPRVQGRPRGGRPTAVQRYLAARSPIDMGAREAAVVPGSWVSYLPSAALVVRREALGAGFDARLRYGEDVDLVWRLLDGGWRVRYDPGAVVWHSEPGTLRAALARRFRYGTSAAPLAARHPGRLLPAVLSPWSAAVALLTLTGRPKAAALLAAQRSERIARRLDGRGLPRRWAARWFAESTLLTATSLGRYLATFALPVTLVLARKAGRPGLLVLLALPLVEDWRRCRPELDPLRWSALALADDAAYGAGVWWSCARNASLRPLIPSVPMK